MVSAKELGEHGTTYPPRIFEQYKEIFNSGASGPAMSDQFKAVGLSYYPLAVWDLHLTPLTYLFAPDILHTILLGMFKHLMKWNVDLLQKYRRLEAFNRLWKNVEGYPGFTPFKKAYTEISQWQGREMRQVARIVLPCLAGAFIDPTDEQKTDFDHAIEATACLVDFYLMVEYYSHSEDTLEYVHTYLADFHHLKAVFLEYCAYSCIKKKAEALCSEMKE